MIAGDRLLFALAPGVAYWAVRGLGLTLRLREVDTHHVAPFWEQAMPLIYAIWHGRILMVPYLYSLYRQSRPVHIMASRSRDGEFVARFMKRSGLQVVRGSTTRGGSEALRALARHLRQGKVVAVTPDGPQGPRYIVQPGIIALARLSGAPIIPLTFSAAPAWHLPSWDEFLIPRPLTRAVVSFGSPVTVPPKSDREEQEALRKELESSLQQLTWRADALLGSR